MAQNKILPWAQTGTANVLSDADYASDVASGGLYGDGVKTGQASSQQANKTWRQATAPGSGLGQFLVDNLGVDVTDADTPSTFSTRIANAVLKLAQISPFNQSWATAIGGYRKYAIVSDSSGNYWVSTADQNVTVPGASGANWQSLFNGYATQSWADGRYIRSPANPNTDARILTISRNKTSGGIFAAADDGSNTQLQPAGDYATNSALQSETQSRITDDATLQTNINTEASTRLAADNALQTALNTETTQREAADSALQTNINTESTTRASAITTLTTNLASETTARENADTTLQSNITAETQARVAEDNALNSAKVNRAGDTMTGPLGVNSIGGISTVYDPGGQTSGSVTQYARLSSNAGGRGGAFSLYVQELVGTAFQGVLLLTYTNGSRYLAVNPGERLFDSEQGHFAYTADLPTSGTITGGYYTKIPLSTGGFLLKQTFLVSAATNGAVITFPLSFSSAPVPPQLTLASNNDVDLSSYDVTATGFTIRVVSSGSFPVVVTVEGEVSA